MSVFPWCHNQLFVKSFAKLVVTTLAPVLTVVIILLIRYKYSRAHVSRPRAPEPRDTCPGAAKPQAPGEGGQTFAPVCRQQSKPDIISPTSRGTAFISTKHYLNISYINPLTLHTFISTTWDGFFSSLFVLIRPPSAKNTLLIRSFPVLSGKLLASVPGPGALA